MNTGPDFMYVSKLHDIYSEGWLLFFHAITIIWTMEIQNRSKAPSNCAYLMKIVTRRNINRNAEIPPTHPMSKDNDFSDEAEPD